VITLSSTEYCLKWIDKLQQLAEAWPGWRSQKEKAHVYAQFDEARAVYRKFLQEAGDRGQTPGQRDAVRRGVSPIP
jgi:hypothetical protein